MLSGAQEYIFFLAFIQLGAFFFGFYSVFVYKTIILVLVLEWPIIFIPVFIQTCDKHWLSLNTELNV